MKKTNGAVKIIDGGVEWYYQTFCNDIGTVGYYNLYDSSGEFVRSFLDLGDMIECIQSGILNKVLEEIKNEKEREDWTSSLRSRKEAQEIIQRRIKRLKDGQSIRKFAKKVDLNSSTVYNYLTGRRFPTIEGLTKIADNCGVTVEWILGRE